MARHDILEIVEALYRPEDTDQRWVDGITNATQHSFDYGFGAACFLFDARNPKQFRIGAISRRGKAERFVLEDMLSVISSGGSRFVKRTFRAVPCATAVASTKQMDPTLVPAFEHTMRPVGAEDMLIINGFETSGVGMWLGVPIPKARSMTVRERTDCARLAAHLAVGYRFHRSLSKQGVDPTTAADAILSPTGKIEDARHDAKTKSARTQLHAAVVALEHARGTMRRKDASAALGEWKGLVGARWSLVDHFERGGRRYVLARRNEPAAHGPETLSPRERLVVSHAALGHSNKLIAYELGVAVSTVGVLLSRAFRKLGVRSRHEAAAAFLSWLQRTAK